MLNPTLVGSALADPMFRLKCPEFASVVAAASSSARPNCSDCQARRHREHAGSSFFAVVETLDDAGIQRLKAYFGISKLMLNRRDPVTHGLALKVV